MWLSHEVVSSVSSYAHTDILLIIVLVALFAINSLMHIKCSAIIKWSIFFQILTKYIPYLTCEGEVCGVFGEFNLG